jgi:hypothetical protein
MWSDRYYYLNIVSDLELSSAFRTQDLTSFLCKQPELVRMSNFKFKNAPDFLTFTDIQLLKANNYSSWSDKDVSHETINMIAVVCAKGGSGKYEPIKNLLIRVAKFLSWQLIDEETDDGVENYIVWQPSSISEQPSS